MRLYQELPANEIGVKEVVPDKPDQPVLNYAMQDDGEDGYQLALNEHEIKAVGSCDGLPTYA